MVRLRHHRDITLQGVLIFLSTARSPCTAGGYFTFSTMEASLAHGHSDIQVVEVEMLDRSVLSGDPLPVTVWAADVK